MALMVYLMKYLVEQKEYIIIIAGIVIALWAINEDMLLTVDTNFLLALIGTAFIDRKDKEYITI
jgi:hypothetical protein